MLNNGVLHLARRTRKVQIIKMQKVERLDPGLNLPVLMPFNPLKGLDDPGGELFVCNGLPQGYVVCSASTQPKHRPTTCYDLSRCSEMWMWRSLWGVSQVSEAS